MTLTLDLTLEMQVREREEKGGIKPTPNL